MSNANPLVSIILPVYNGDQYISIAINSVINQSYTNWELLIVDDGSTDNSASVCDSYSEKDTRIRTFHRPNGGVNSARAKGVDNARGIFLTFLDADDALLSDALDYMVGHFQDGIDLVAHGRFNEQVGREKYIKTLWEGGTGLVLWGKMFRTSVFKQIDYALEQRMVMGEDLLLNSVYALDINTAYIFSHEIYQVNRDNETSVTRTFKHNWEYEKYYFSQVEDRFLSKCKNWDSYEDIHLLVNKSWLNALKYVMLDGGSICYNDPAFKAVRSFFKGKKGELGPSERMIFIIKNARVYRLILKIGMKMRNRER